MKNYLLLCLCCAALSLSSQAQIDFLSEYEVAQSNVVIIDDNEPKIYATQNSSVNFSLYNLDGTLFREFEIPQDNITGLVQVLYISRSLFDCDTTTIEYAINHVDFPSPSDPTNNNWVKIMNEDGTELFHLDNATLYEGNSQFMVANSKSIVNSPNGAVMKIGFNYDAGSPMPAVSKYYQLCGSLPVLKRTANMDDELTGLWDQESSIRDNFVIFPNPNETGLIQFEIDESLAGTNGVIRLFSMNGRLLQEAQVNLFETRQSMDVSTLPAGTYLLNVQLEDGNIVNEVLVKL